MEWLDFFLQTFVTALAWCLAVAVVLGGAIGGLWLSVIWSPLARPARRWRRGR